MSDDQSPILVIGPGAWGSALALVLARNGQPVRLWGNDVAQMASLKQDHANEALLPGYCFPDCLQVVLDFDQAIDGVRDVLVVVPSSAFVHVIEMLKPYHARNALRIAWGTKGLHPQTNGFLHTWVQEQLGDMPLAVIAGPSFAAEVAASLPTAVNIASTDAEFCLSLQQRFNSDCFRLFPVDDMVGVQLGSVVKNVLAVASGINDGLKLGINARSALMTMGLLGMNKLSIALGGKHETLMDLSGLGDLVLTCTDNQSRNRRFGLALGRGMSVDEAMEHVGHTVEGWFNVGQLYQLAQANGVTTPIIQRVYAVLYEGADPVCITRDLISMMNHR